MSTSTHPVAPVPEYPPPPGHAPHDTPDPVSKQDASGSQPPLFSERTSSSAGRTRSRRCRNTPPGTRCTFAHRPGCWCTSSAGRTCRLPCRTRRCRHTTFRRRRTRTDTCNARVADARRCVGRARRAGGTRRGSARVDSRASPTPRGNNIRWDRLRTGRYRSSGRRRDPSTSREGRTLRSSRSIRPRWCSPRTRDLPPCSRTRRSRRTRRCPSEHSSTSAHP